MNVVLVKGMFDLYKTECKLLATMQVNAVNENASQEIFKKFAISAEMCQSGRMLNEIGMQLWHDYTSENKTKPSTFMQ